MIAKSEPASPLFADVFTRRIFLAGLVLCLSRGIACAQGMALDPGFDLLITRQGGVINAIATQPDQKTILAGRFELLNTTVRGSIARINPDGSLDTGFNAAVEPGGEVHTVAVQSDGKLIIGGRFTSINGTTRTGIARLNLDGSLDTAFNPDLGIDRPVYAAAVQSDGKVVIAGGFSAVNGVVRNHIARLNPEGSLDTGFNPAVEASGEVHAVAAQSDGKLVIGGRFTLVGGTARSGIARLNQDGSLDTGFDPGSGADDEVRQVAMQTDGKVVLAGLFRRINGTPRHLIARINPNGSLDSDFSPQFPGDEINAVVLQSDGKIVLGGRFDQVNGVPRKHLVRLDEDGSVDSGFDLNSIPNRDISAAALQGDGKLILAGLFTSVGATPRNQIARLNADGSLDNGFKASLGAPGWLHAVAVQSDGKVLIGGEFSMVDGAPRNGIARLNTDGSLDAAFDPDGADYNGVFDIAIADDGKVLLGGSFNTTNGVSRNRIARLNSDGTLDTGFDPGSGITDPILGPSVAAVALQKDGKVVIGGGFWNVDGMSRLRIARLNSDGSVDPEFQPQVGPPSSPFGELPFITCLAVQSDGKIIVGGYFTNVNETVRNNLARLNSDGSLDLGFDPGPGADGIVHAVLLQSDGKMVVGGDFDHVNAVVRNGLARLNPDGSVDPGFDPGYAGAAVKALAFQSDGKLLAGGIILKTESSPLSHAIRLNPNGSLAAGFDVEAAGGDPLPFLLDALAIQPGDNVIVAGNFTSVNGQPRICLARLRPVTAPLLAAPRLTAESSFAMTVAGQAGILYRVEASGDLISWLPLTNFTATADSNEFTDASAVNLVRRFYRVVVP